ncbi:MAG: hypothetical protein QM767_16345 [Anaeromyxobacter sp.]
MPTRPLVQVQDRVLPASLHARLAAAVRALGTEGLATTYQTTFWFELGAPSALPELAILALAPRLPLRGLAGVEWWLSRMRTSDVRVDFHRDLDERLYRATGRVVHPAFTSVLFLNRCRGGLLAVTEAAPNPARPACAPDPLDADLVRPWPNRLALIRGSATHGVLDADGCVPAEPIARATGLRLALIVNGWRHRPTRVPAFARARRYPSLRLATGGRKAPAGS